MPDLPAWPAPPPYTCAGRATTSVLTIIDPATSLPGQVGIAPGGGDPNAYLTFWAAPGCLQAWCAAIWAEFIGSGTPYSTARFIWDSGFLTGANFPGSEVYPNQAGGYSTVIDLDTFPVVEYCPP